MNTKLNLAIFLFCLNYGLHAQENIFEASQRRMKDLQIEYRAYVAEIRQTTRVKRTRLPGTVRILPVHNPEMKSPERVNKASAVSAPKPVAANSHVPDIFPVEGSPRITSGYGSRSDPFTHRRAFHGGIDLSMDVGTDVHCTAAGRVSRAAYDRRSGRYLVIEHGNGYKSTYCHLSECLVRPGEVVRKGQVIALSGDTGRATGPHLHYALHSNGKNINPLSVISH